MKGKACVSVFPYYDKQRRQMAFKNRPVLVIGKADDKDYVILPISRITTKDNMDSYYDVPIDPKDVPLMNLKQLSYIRTHKQSVVNVSSLVKVIVDFSVKYEDTYLEVISKVEEFQKHIIDNALK